MKVDTSNGGWLEKTGVGDLSFDYGLTGQNFIVSSGSLTLSDGDSLGTLEFGTSRARSASPSVNVNGVVSIGTLTGTGGTFNMSVTFGGGDKDTLKDAGVGLKIDNASGNHFLNIKASNSSSAASAQERIKVADIASGTGTLALANGLSAIDYGGYEYQLVTADGESGGTGYFLSSYLNDNPDSERMISVTAGTYTAIASAAQLFDVSLHDRVGNRSWVNPLTGEKHVTSIWWRESVIHERYRDSSGQLGIHNTSSVTMIGGDLFQWTPSGDGEAYFGAMAGYGMMDSKSRSRYSASRSDADTDAWGVGFYGGWKAKADSMTGPYVDGWVMFTHAKSEVDSSTGTSNDVRGRGLSASLEAGWGFNALSYATDSGNIADLIVEPHASVTWFGLEYDELHTDRQDVVFEGKNNIRTRLGARFILSERNSPNFNAFLEANWVHNTENYGATISGVRVDQAGARNQGEGRIGIDWRITESTSAWARIGISVGDDGYNEREGSVGIRYRF